jgi:type IV pilus biogenesis protein CpaD/CtpE
MSNELKVAYCSACGNIFQMNMRGLCSNCSAKEDIYVNSIEKTLIRNRQLNIDELAHKAEIPREKILSFIRKGKIKLFEYPNLADECDVCASPIRRGTMCTKCATRIQNEIAHELEQERLMKERIKTSNYFSKTSG